MPKPAPKDRPLIETIKTGSALRRWYWRKDELVPHARALGLKITGAKFTLLDRIAHFLDTGETRAPGEVKPRPTSRFDWHSEPLGPETVITDSYKNTQNVRRFFTEHAAPNFRFNIAFMGWMKANTGATLGDACAEYHAMKQRENDLGFRSEIAAHNQFNQYTRDFLDDNPHLDLNDVRRIWALKIARPSDTGRHLYHPDDLKLANP